MIDAPERKPKTPKGYKDEAEFLEEARELFQRDVDFDRANREEAVEDLKFFAGDQWDDAARADRNGKPCLTINDLPAKVAQVTGDMRINKPAIRVRPAEDADKDLAEVREGLIRAIERDSDAQGVYISTAESQVICGIGNYRIALKNADAAGFEKDIRPEAIPDAFAVVWDAFSTERTGKDAERCFVVDQMPRKAFERRWKKEIPSDLEVPTSDANGWYDKDEVRVTEYWRMLEEPCLYARLEGGSTVEVVEDALALDGYLQVQRGRKERRLPLVAPIATDDDGEPMVREGVRRYACMYLITGHAILSGPHELPIPRLPIIRVRGWEVNVREKRVRFGLVRFARDPARLKNYWRSVSAEMLELAGKGKWLLHESSEGDQDAFRDAHTDDDPILVWSGQVKPEYVGPPSLNSAVLQEAALSAQDMKDVTGLHDASLGAKSNETSGKAILARQKEGDVGTFIYSDNLQAAIAEGGRVIDALIPLAFDTARSIRTLGEDETTKIQRINDPADPKSVDINRGKFDIVVESGPSYSTKRVEAAESMAQFFQVVPAAAQAAGDLFAKAQDWPLATEIGERLKKTLPPGMADEDEDPTPEQQAAKQQAMQAAQAQQQMQQQAAQLGMAEQAAKVKGLEATAAKTMAEAQKLMMPEPANDQHPGDPRVDALLAIQNLRKATAEADKAETEAQRSAVQLEADKLDLMAKPAEQAMAQATTAKALSEPPKAPAAKG